MSQEHFQELELEETVKKLPYPKSVFFIASNELCERFSYYGMRTILVLYLTSFLQYTEGSAKIIFHTFATLVFLFPLIGGILSDSFLGKFRTILYLSILYASGNILLSLSAVEPIGLPQREFTLLALFLIALGTGGIKPCIFAFGGDQFILPGQEQQLEKFFSLFYLLINVASLLSALFTPILRNNVHCFGQESCFPLAFVVPGILMILSIVLFLLGKPMYKIKNPQKNMLLEVTRYIRFAITRKFKRNSIHSSEETSQTLDPKLVNDIKATLNVFILYIPLPIFWALHDQQGSEWTLQAVRMNGYIGFYTILPDQMQILNPIFIMMLIPCFTYGIYPLMAKCGLLKTPLQRMVCGGFLAAAAFVVSGFVSMSLTAAYPVLPSSGRIQIRVYNPSSCNVTVNAADLNLKDVYLEQLGYYENKDILFNGSKSVVFKFNSDCFPYPELAIPMKEGTAYGIFFVEGRAKYFEDNISKSENGYPKIRTLAYDSKLVINYTKGNTCIEVEDSDYSLKYATIPGTYRINGSNKEILFQMGGTYSVMISSNSTHKMNVRSFTTVEPNSVHILWLLPQYLLITSAETMFTIAGLEFSYSQAPASMKSVVLSAFLLTIAFGNFIIVLVEAAQIFALQSNNLFLYAGLMTVDMLIFSYIAHKYVYVTIEKSDK